MTRDILIVCLCALPASWGLTGVVRAQAVRHGLLDVPNQRSSHAAVIPRGGGAAIVLVLSLAAVLLAARGELRPALLWTLLGGLAIAAVGFADDRRAVHAGVRLLVHFAAAVWAVFWLGGLTPLPIGGHLVDLGWAGHVIAVLAVVWTLNLFNFMDGIDGIAASEAVFVAAGGAALCLWAGGWSDALAAGFVLAAACAGFLPWNWSPARIFLGDVGSGYLGYTISVLALAATSSNPVAVWVWLILGGVFFADATVSLVRRVARGERAQDAHRSHAYQWLARRWGSHRRVTLSVLAVNLLWLLPWAVAAVRYPAHAAVMVLAALVPLAALALLAGAGRREAE